MRGFKQILGLIALFSSLSSFAQSGFIENKGQFHENVLYEADFHQQKIYLDKQGFTVLLHDEEQWENIVEQYHEHSEVKNKFFHSSTEFRFHALKYTFIGADLTNSIGTETAQEYFNYYIGQDQSKWASKAKKHYTIVYQNAYPNIDIEFQAIDQRFKYNFILHPGADINDIQLKIEGADDISVNSSSIDIKTRFGDIHEIMPISYILGSIYEKEIVLLTYKMQDGIIGFEAPEAYLETDVLDSSQLIIDPELVFSTYAGNTVDNFGFTATYDSRGNLYAGGIASGPSALIPNGRYPVTTGAFDVTFNQGQGREPANLACDITISKYDSTGATLLYATYLGGNDDEYPHSLVVDRNDNLIIFGTTYSFDFPLGADPPQPIKSSGTDLILVKLTEDGSGLIGSTFLGGSANDGLNQSSATKYFYADDFRGEVNIDTNNLIYIASTTASSNFPTKNAFQGGSGGGQDGVLACFSANIDELLWASYFGGSKDDAIYSVDIAANGDLYISGGTASTNLSKTDGSFGEAYSGGRTDGFVSKIKDDGSSIIQSAYYGTERYDQILSLEIDKYGNIFVVGQSDGGMPTKGTVYQNSRSGQFVSKFNADLSSVLLSTVYGSGKNVPDITINAFLVDECDKIFVSGWGGSLYVGPQAKLKDMPLTHDAIDTTTDGNDFHLIVFRKDFKDLVYGTYFGGDRTDDHVDGGTSRFDKKGVIYQSVCSSCPPSSDGQNSQVSDFPTSPGAFAEQNLSPRCSNASFKLAFGNLNRKPELKEEIYKVYATDTISFAYTITDPDDDTLHAWVDYSADVDDNFISKQDKYSGVSRLTAHFVYSPGCENIGDTLSFPVYSLDVGCPAAKDSSSLFKIVIQPPPLLPPPGVVCLNFLDKDALKIEWEATAVSKFFKEMRLYRIDPSGNKTLLNTYTSQNAGTYTDADVVNPRNRNYTYYLEVVNICDLVGPKSYDLSSVKEHEIPVEPTYLKTVTVEGERLRIEWLRSTEDDFGHYEIYKSKRDGSETEFLTIVHDVDSLYYYDSDVNVNDISYCYQIRVSDDCGHLSAKSNIGCSIVIRGESLPFEFDLNWDDYIDWAAGVHEYELLRSTDTGSLRPIVRVDQSTRTYIDGDLDYDWGGYWYSVIAYEAAGSQDATSRSNDIYLIQPPLVFVPNAFTANNDNLNDAFGWSDVFVLDFELSIYNRWGEKVFETTDKNAEWNGIYKDNGLKNSNVYVWIVKYTGWDRSAHYQRGTVTIIR